MIPLRKHYIRLKKLPGGARILASVIVQTEHEQSVKIVFIRHRHKRDWLTILSTDIDLRTDEIVCIYGKRCDFEVFFNMMKYHLHHETEAYLSDYNGIIGHTTIAMIRYIFLVVEQRCHDDR